MFEYRVSFRYARAILESSVKEGVEDLIYDDFQEIATTFDMSRELRTFAASPIVQIWKKKKILKAILDEELISPLAIDFIMLLIDKRRGNLIPSIIAQYDYQYNVLKGKLPVEIESAVELTEDTKKRISGKIGDWTKKFVLPEFKINKDIKGGLLVKIEDWVFDATLRNQLEVLHKKLIEGVN